MDDQSFKTSLVNKEILVLQMGGGEYMKKMKYTLEQRIFIVTQYIRSRSYAQTQEAFTEMYGRGTIDKDFPKHLNHGKDLEITDSAVRRILSKIRPLRSILVRLESIARKNSFDITDADRSALVHTILNSSNHRYLVTHGTETITKTASYVAQAFKESGVKNKSVVFTGATTPERFRDSDADVNVGVALGFLQSEITGVWVCLGGLVLPWDRAYKQKDGQFVPRRKSMPVVV